MEANLRQDMPLVALPDLAGSQGCADLLTRSNSEEESDLTVEDLKNTFLRTEDSTPIGQVVSDGDGMQMLVIDRDQSRDKCTTWTDEKHNLYLHHLESSFVEQLHRSMGLSRKCSELETEGTSVSRKLSTNKQHTSEQLTVLQDGSWKKIELKSNRPILKIAAESLVVLKNPWIQHLRCADKSRIITSAHSQEYNPVPTGGKRLGGKRIFSNESATSSEQIPVSLRIHNGSVDSTEEFSDQNFADEVLEEKPSTFMSKRSKSSVADASSQDQIVPLGKSYMAVVSAPGHTSSKVEEKAHRMPT